MSKDDAKNWFIHQVVAAYDAYVEQRDRATTGRLQHQRTALIAATALFHFREHLPAEWAISQTTLESQCYDYKIVTDVSNAAKHKNLDRGNPIIDCISSVEERAVVTQFVGDGEPYTHAYTYILVSLPDGSKKVFDLHLTNLMNFWSDYLNNKGIIASRMRPYPRFLTSDRVSRADAKPLNFEAMRGIDWKPIIELRRFNLKTNQPENCDLSDANFQMNFRPHR